MATIILQACNQPSNQADVVQKIAPDASKSTASTMADTATVISREDAETLIAMHYSRLNREKQYLFYQGLLVRIDSITGKSKDTQRIHSTIHGRKWLTPNGDTVTQPFKENRTLNAWRKDLQWSSD
jgi:hypothetical protein